MLPNRSKYPLRFHFLSSFADNVGWIKVYALLVFGTYLHKEDLSINPEVVQFGLSHSSLQGFVLTRCFGMLS